MTKQVLCRWSELVHAWFLRRSGIGRSDIRSLAGHAVDQRIKTMHARRTYKDNGRNTALPNKPHAGESRSGGTWTYSASRIASEPRYDKRQDELSRHSCADACCAACHVEVVIMSCSLVCVFAASLVACFDCVRVCEAGWVGHAVRVRARERT